MGLEKSNEWVSKGPKIYSLNASKKLPKKLVQMEVQSMGLKGSNEWVSKGPKICSQNVLKNLPLKLVLMGSKV